MAVSITWSLTNGGTAISSDVNGGTVSNGSSSSATTIYVRHDGTNEITACALYLNQYSGSYTGGATAAADFSEIVGWGDGATSSTFGGFQVNMDATGGFSAGAWPTYSSKSPTNGFAVRTGTGDSSGNAVTLTTATGCSSSGVIPAGSSPNVRFQYRVAVPTSENTPGVRQWDQVLLYTYTS